MTEDAKSNLPLLSNRQAVWAKQTAGTAGMMVLSVAALILVAAAAPFVVIGSAIAGSLSKGSGRWRASGA